MNMTLRSFMPGFKVRIRANSPIFKCRLVLVVSHSGVTKQKYVFYADDGGSKFKTQWPKMTNLDAFGQIWNIYLRNGIFGLTIYSNI